MFLALCKIESYDKAKFLAALSGKAYLLRFSNQKLFTLLLIIILGVILFCTVFCT